jgi:hypothetical protein
VGFVVDKVALAQGFSDYFGFPCQSSLHRLLHTHHLSSEDGAVGQIVADVPSGLSLTPPEETKEKNRTKLCSLRCFDIGNDWTISHDVKGKLTSRHEA